MEIVAKIGPLIGRSHPRDSHAIVEVSPEGLLIWRFPRAKNKDKFRGKDGFDLANACLEGLVKPSDMLVIGLPPLKGKNSEQEKFFYIRPGFIHLSSGRAGKHTFLSADAEPRIITVNPYSWAKVAEGSPTEFTRAWRKVFGENDSATQLLAAAERRIQIFRGE